MCRLVRERLKNEVEKMRTHFSGFRPSLVVLQVSAPRPVVLHVSAVVLQMTQVVL